MGIVSIVKLTTTVFLAVAAGFCLSLVAYAANQQQTDGGYGFTVDDGKATITRYFGPGSDFMMIPSNLGGYPVTTMGDGNQILFSNNRSRGVVLFPDSVKKISNRAIYDYNDTYYISIPSSVTTIEDGATSSIAIAKLAGVKGSQAELYANQIGIGFSDETVQLKAEVGKGGSMSKSGTYLIPKLLERAYDLSFDFKADPGFRIKEVVVNGKVVKAAENQRSYALQYKLAARNELDISIQASFSVETNATTTDADAEETAPDTAASYEFPDYGASAGKYANAIGVCGGNYYATTENGKTVVYKLVDTYASKDGSLVFRNKEEVKAYASKKGLVFRKDYDRIHVYNYNDPTDQDRLRGGDKGISYYVAYLYKAYTGSTERMVSKVGSFETAKADYSKHLNTSSLFAQNGAQLTLKDWTFNSYSNYVGPTEGTNFYGAASALLADSGAVINLVNPSVDGSANIAFGTYNGKINITGGYLLGTAPAAHGPYVAYGGEIYVNAPDGTQDPGIITRPAEDQAYIQRDKKSQRVTLINNMGPDGTPIITTQPTGTALATDAGGGIIVANNVIAKTYGGGSAGVYSIGSNEGLVYVYNSVLTSYMDAGLVSASGGYIYANNAVIQGLMGIKLRAGQNSAEMSEVRVKNSKLIAFYDAEEAARVFDVSIPDEATASELPDAETGTFSMNMFVNARTGWKMSKDVFKYWFEDGYTLVPGAGGGNGLATIYTEGSKTPVYVESTRLVNRNYEKYKDAPGSKAENLIISSEGNGTANVFFVNNNSRTKWDLTGVSDETTEIAGDFNIAEASKSTAMMGGMPGNGGPGAGGPPPGGGGPGGGGPGIGGPPPGGHPGGNGLPGADMEQSGNYLNANFENSEWEGTLSGVSRNANLVFDSESSWKVTKDTELDTLTVASGTVIFADKPVTVSYQKLIVLGGGKFKFGKNVTGIVGAPNGGKKP
jgi:hypothetical protein